MTPKVIITAAITGAGDTVGKHPAIPVTPEHIATSALEAARAGAAVVHCHVRDPKTGKSSRAVSLYREVVERIRSANRDVVINLTAGMGSDLEIGEDENPLPIVKDKSDLVGPVERLLHVAAIRPDICTLDCGSLNFGDGNFLLVQTPSQLRAQAKLIQGYGVKPELECFDSGNVWFAKQLCAEGLISTPLFQLCLGIPWGAPYDSQTMAYQKSLLPPGAIWAAFGIGRNEFPAVAQAVLLGGHVRVGLEDNLWLEKGVYASNATLVEKATKIVRLLGAEIASTSEARAMLGLPAAA